MKMKMNSMLTHCGTMRMTRSMKNQNLVEKEKERRKENPRKERERKRGKEGRNVKQPRLTREIPFKGYGKSTIGKGKGQHPGATPAGPPPRNPGSLLAAYQSQQKESSSSSDSVSLFPPGPAPNLAKTKNVVTYHKGEDICVPKVMDKPRPKAVQSQLDIFMEGPVPATPDESESPPPPTWKIEDETWTSPASSMTLRKDAVEEPEAKKQKSGKPG